MRALFLILDLQRTGWLAIRTAQERLARLGNTEFL
jgi:hypothetical protein